MAYLVEPIDHGMIDPDALKVVHRLVRYNHEAYLVGGCVRDLLLGQTPKDFDVATSATPNQIRSLFRNARVIGRRFRLVHIFFGPKIIETATFRKNPKEPELDDPALADALDQSNGEDELPPPGDDEPWDDDLGDGDPGDGDPGGGDPGDGDPGPDNNPGPNHLSDASLLIRQDNVFGSAEDDALRRDFTMNGLFYDPVRRKVIDFADGRADLERRLIRTIGDPDIRFQEDPVRILRAIKFAARLGLTIEPQTLAAICRHRESIRLCAKARVLEEIFRILREGSAAPAMALLMETGVQEILLPELGPTMTDPRRRELLFARLLAIDSLSSTMPLTNALLMGALFFGTLIPQEAIFSAHPGDRAELDSLLKLALESWTPSRRDRDRVRQILMAQRRLAPDTAKRRKRKPGALVAQDTFRESLALYSLLCHTGEADPSTLEKWESLAERAGSHGAPSDGRPGQRPRRGPMRGGPSRPVHGTRDQAGQLRDGSEGRKRRRRSGRRRTRPPAAEGGGTTGGSQQS